MCVCVQQPYGYPYCIRHMYMFVCIHKEVGMCIGTCMYSECIGTSIYSAWNSLNMCVMEHTIAYKIYIRSCKHAYIHAYIHTSGKLCRTVISPAAVMEWSTQIKAMLLLDTELMLRYVCLYALCALRVWGREDTRIRAKLRSCTVMYVCMIMTVFAYKCDDVCICICLFIHTCTLHKHTCVRAYLNTYLHTHTHIHREAWQERTRNRLDTRVKHRKPS